MSDKREGDNIHTQLSVPFCAHNSPLFLLAEAITVEKRFYKIEQEQIKPTWNQKKWKQNVNSEEAERVF